MAKRDVTAEKGTVSQVRGTKKKRAVRRGGGMKPPTPNSKKLMKTQDLFDRRRVRKGEKTARNEDEKPGDYERKAPQGKRKKRGVGHSKGEKDL